MRALLFLLRKEFLQISRNHLILRMIFAIPVVQLIILPNAANYEMKNINMSIVDHDHSEYSRQLINKFTSSGYFQLTNVSETYKDALVVVEEDKADLIVEIPQGHTPHQDGVVHWTGWVAKVPRRPGPDEIAVSLQSSCSSRQPLLHL